MPFYTFKCRTCGLEKEEIRSMNDFKESERISKHQAFLFGQNELPLFH